jgi:hypothetical protein
MKITKLFVLMLLCAAGQFSVTAYAQNPLIVFVENAENATSLHEEVANSIAPEHNATCFCVATR